MGCARVLVRCGAWWCRWPGIWCGCAVGPLLFGVFAGVAALRFGPRFSTRWTDDHYVRTRADAVWLAAVIASLESCPALRRHLPVTVNDLVVVRGERLVGPRHPGTGAPGRGTSVEVSVRHSPPVQTIMQAVRSPIRIGDLTDKLAAEFPDAEFAAIDGMVAELVARGVLITSLRLPSTSTDGLAHVLHQLQEVDAAALGDAAPLVGELRAIHTQLQATGRATSWVDGQARRVTAARMRALSNAADQREYHGRFLSRYGSGAVVPVEQLVDPTAGLGFPRHYSQQERPVQAEMSRRDEQWLRLAQQAALDSAREIVLDDDDIDALAVSGRDAVRPAPHVDLCVEIRALTATALAEGAFLLAVTGIGRTAIATSGRFLDIVSDADRQRMVALYGRLPVGVEGALPAQLSFPPNHPRVHNVGRAPMVLPHVISLGEHRGGVRGRIPVQDLAVTADNDRLYVVSLSRRRVVEPVLAHAAARHTMPALARLLCEIPRATSAAVSLMDWGAGACLPFLPRVRYGRSILATARWRVPAGALPGPAAPRREWMAAMAAVRERLRLPSSVSVGTADRRLRLNLDDPLDLALLRAHLDAVDDAVTVAEAPTAADHGWFAGRAHEIVIPLASTAPPARTPAVVTGSGPLPLIGHEHGRLPGSQVLFAKVYGHPDVVNTILTRHLPTLLAAWDEPPVWWFVRYRTPAPHLRLRLHHLQDYGQAADLPPGDRTVWIRSGDGRRRGPVRCRLRGGRRPAQGPGQLAGGARACTDRGESGRPGLRHDGKPARGDAVAHRPRRTRGLHVGR